MDLDRYRLNLAIRDNLAKILESKNNKLLQKEMRYEYELAMAADIQKKLFPQKIPQDKGLQIAVSNTMARSVGGDFYDFMINQHGQLAVLVADTMGKGLSAALLTATLRAIWRSCSETCPVSPGQILGNINRAMYADLEITQAFVTAFAAIYDPKTSVLRYSSAGHNPPIFCSVSTSAHQILDVGGFPLGISLDAEFPSAEVAVQKDDVVIIYTDGVVEAEDANNELFGLERLCDLVEQHLNSSPEDIKSVILGAIDTYTNSSPPNDDTTIVVLKKA